MSTKRTKESLLNEIEELKKFRTELKVEMNGLRIRVEILEKRNKDEREQLLSFRKQCVELSYERELLVVQLQKAKNLAHALVEEGTRLVWSKEKKEGK